MTIAVLPFNAGPNTKPALARQFANFACDIVRNNTGAEVNAVNYLIRLDESPNPRLANVNPSETYNEHQMIAQLFEQAGADAAMDGLLVQENGSFKLGVRFFEKGSEEPVRSEERTFKADDLFPELRKLITELAETAGKKLPEELKEDENLFGTSNAQAFLRFIEAYDALQYIDKTQGQVAVEFSPEPAIENLVESQKLDLDWEAPYVTLVQLCRACTNFQISTAEILEKGLKEIIEVVPDDGRAIFALGELYHATGNLAAASETFERAAVLEPNEPAIITRLGIVQMQMGMPVNAERNFRKALEMEGEEKPSLDFLAQVLQATNRGHEVPGLWRDHLAKNPDAPEVHAKIATSLINAGQEEEGVKAFEEALTKLEDATVVKRFYAPYLASKQDFDRAMDFYEDCLDTAPADVQLLLEYAQTLQAANRTFEVPKVLKDVLAANPDPNIRAQTMAWLIELEQPKRVESVQNAQQKLESNDFEGALRDLKPVQNWLADYWKMWALLAAANNRLEQFEEAEKAATALVNLFPGCEPAYGELATALGSQNKHQEAYNAMRFGMSNVQNSLPIAINYALAAKRIGNHDEARALAKQIREAIGTNEQLDPILDDLMRS